MAPDWPSALIPLGIAVSDPEAADPRDHPIGKSLDAFRESLKSRPFGNSETIARAQSVVVETESLLKVANRAHLDDNTARRFLDRLCEMADMAIPDYESARQIGWAFRVIYDEIVPKQQRDPVIESALADIASELALDLPPAKQQSPIESAIPVRLKSSADFDPGRFRAHFRKIGEHLARTKPLRTAAGR